MIRFDNWTIQPDGEVIARQFDNLTRTLTICGDLPEGWEWSLLVQAGEAMDILLLEPVEGGVGITLTAQQLSIAGYYQMQLRGTQGDLVRHTNMVTVYIPASLSGDEQWPTVPSEFTDLERRVNEKAKEAEGYTAHPPIHGDNGNWWLWDGEAYADSGKPYTGEPGADGKDGADGKTPVRGVDYYTPEDVEAIVADATKRVEASFGGTYELVEEITTTEELTAIRRAEHPDGTPYNFKSMILKMEIPAGAGTGLVNITFSDKAGWQLGFSSNNTIATSNRWAWTRIFRDYDRWHCEFSVGSTQYAQTVYRQVGGNEVFGERYGMVGILNIKTNTSGVPLPTGTIIRIYGVRA